MRFIALIWYCNGCKAWHSDQEAPKEHVTRELIKRDYRAVVEVENMSDPNSIGFHYRFWASEQMIEDIKNE